MKTTKNTRRGDDEEATTMTKMANRTDCFLWARGRRGLCILSTKA